MVAGSEFCGLWAWRGWSVLILIALVPPRPLLADPVAHPQKSIQAVRINPHAPILDGRLDDLVWQKAPKAGDFVQRDPDEGKAASEATSVQLAYDDEALYIAVMCYDSEPDKIVARLARRDRWVEADRVSVYINPHHDHKTGYYFSVGASGWFGDGVLFDDTDDDNTWDGVWQVKTALGDQGWSAEFKIPYHVLRFSPKQEYTWGLNVRRDISRKQERAFWVLVPKGESGWVSRFGHIEGIAGIKPPNHLEVLPFALGRSSFRPEDDGGRELLFSAFGADLRYGLGPNVSLNATVNPDFGQVEADPAVLNLGVFETFFRERRPFFIEGNSIFNAPGPGIVGIGGPARLFHSRRIGKQPGRRELPDDSEVVDKPDNTTILAATKVSGKSGRGTAFGLVNAVTSPEDATIERTSRDPFSGAEVKTKEAFELEPLSNYFAGRVQQDVLANSTLGATLTAVNGRRFDPAYVGSVDGHFKWKDNAYRIFTRFSGSRAGQFDERGSGYEGTFYFSKFSGWLGGQFYADARSPGFEVNDLGFMNRNDRIQVGSHIYAEIHNPWALARRSGFNLNAWSHWNYDGLNLRQGVNFNSWHTLKNYWWFNFGLDRYFKSMDDLATRGGPPMVQPAGIEYWVGLGTDDRKMFSLGFDVWGYRDDGGDSYGYWLWIGPELRPAANIEIDISPTYNYQRRFAQWIENADSDGDGEDDRYIFGELENQVLDLTVRATVSFTPQLSVQVFAQPFVAVGDYTRVKELARPKSYAFVAYDGLEENPDFSERSLRSNVVLRWEYNPGSTFFLVWSQSRSGSPDLADPDFAPLAGVGNSFTDAGQNIFLVKFNYWLGI